MKSRASRPSDNIGPRGISARLWMGRAALLAALVLIGVWFARPMGRWISPVAGLLTFWGFLNVLQARERTCVLLAARSLQDRHDRGTAPETDARSLTIARRRAALVLVLSAAAGLLVALALSTAMPHKASAPTATATPELGSGR